MSANTRFRLAPYTLGLLLFTSVAARANEGTASHTGHNIPTVTTPGSAVEVRSFGSPDGKLNLQILKKSPEHRLYITLKDAKGERLYTKFLGKQCLQHWLRLNVEELADGDYMLEVKQGTDRIIKFVRLTTPVVRSSPRAVAIQPFVPK